jgi:hypothetical protein
VTQLAPATVVARCVDPALAGWTEGTGPGLASLAFTGETMFPPWAPFFGLAVAGVVV